MNDSAVLRKNGLLQSSENLLENENAASNWMGNWGLPVIFRQCSIQTIKVRSFTLLVLVQIISERPKYIRTFQLPGNY